MKHIADKVTCAQLVPPTLAEPKTQQQIAIRAFELWLARGFRNGSPQEDWLQAQLEVQQRSMQAGGRNG